MDGLVEFPAAGQIRKRLSFSAAEDVFDGISGGQSHAAVSEAVEKYKKQLESMDLAKLGITRFTEAAKLERERLGKLTPAQQLSRVKAHFSKLKFLYLELESKKGFLEAISDEQVITQDVDAVIGQSTAEKVEAARSSAKEAKATTKQLAADVDEWAKQLTESYDALNAERQLVSELLEAYAQQHGGAVEGSLAKKPRSEGLEGEASTTPLKSVADFPQIQELLAGMEYETRDIKDRIAGTKQRLAAELNRRAKEEEEERQKIGDKVWEMHEWYRVALPLVEKLGGVTVREYLTDGIAFGLRGDWIFSGSTQEETVHVETSSTLTVEFTPESVQIEKVVLTPNSVIITDLVSHAMRLQKESEEGEGIGLVFLVREVKSRLVARAAILAEIDFLRKNHHVVVGWTGHAAQTELQSHVSVSIGSKNLSFDAVLPPDYPLGPAGVEVQCLRDGDADRSKEATDAFQSQLVAKHTPVHVVDVVTSLI